MKLKPDLSFWKLWNLSFGFFGVQIAYALQSSQVSRIFSTIGADPHDLSYFWILPPLMGLIVQPIVGMSSDRTWNKLGRRLPYLVLGAVVAIIVMCFLPNAGSLGLAVSSAIIFGLIMLMLLDTSINMAMQPFKMLVGDMVNEKQKGKAYSIQSFLCNAGSVVGYILPFVLAGEFFNHKLYHLLSNTAPEGEVPQTVIWAFYIGAAILLLCVIYTFAKVKEWPPEVYAQYNGGGESTTGEKKKKENMFRLLVKAPKVFWTVGLVQFFCWAAFLYMWTYSTDAIAGHAFNTPSVQKVTGVKINGVQYNDDYLFNGQQPLLEKGKLTLGGIKIDSEILHPQTVEMNGEKLISEGAVVYIEGVAALKLNVSPEEFAPAGTQLIVDGSPVTVAQSAETLSALGMTAPGTPLTLAHIAARNHETGLWELEEIMDVAPFASLNDVELDTKTVLNTESSQYQKAGDWNGVLLAVQGIVAVLWAMLLPKFRNRKLGYALSLLIGGIGFLSIMLFHNQYMLLISYGLAGVAWAAMLAMPFTILTNALSGGNIGTYLGLFNGTITIPQIVAALIGGFILSLFPLAANGVAPTVYMLLVSGILLVLGAASVFIIKETYGSKTSEE